MGLERFRYRQALRAALRGVWAHVPGSADWFVGDAVMDAYVCAFTPESVDPDHNYEFFEILGDASVNKSVTWYFQERFPHLRCAAGVPYLARLKINTIAKSQLARWTIQLGLDPFVRGGQGWTYTGPGDAAPLSTTQMSVLEDVFEAMLGVTELRVDGLAGARGAGYAAVYSLVARLLDPVPFELSYEALWDPKTRLKEVFDAQPGFRLAYVHNASGGDRGFAAEVWVHAGSGTVRRRLLATSSPDPGRTFGRRIEAEQAAAERALAYLRSQPPLAQWHWDRGR